MKTLKYPKNKSDLEYYLQGLISRKFTLKQVAKITGYTPQHLSKLKNKYKKIGKNVLQNGHKGLIPKNKISPVIRKKIIEIYKNDFEGVNFNFFKKALGEFYDIHLSYKTIYRILSEAKIESPEKRKKPKKDKSHRPRFRRESAGDLVQIDATPFQWFLWSGDKSYYTLHGAIDDATGEITGLCMTENECSYGYYDILEQTIENRGIMFEIYSDRAAIFCVNSKDKNKLTIQEQLAGISQKRTQWQRILDDLHIKQILAWSPQAKGRVERMWKTIQGRLPWYFKHYKIKTIEAANCFLKEKFLEIFNKEFGIKEEKKDVWRKPPANFKNMICSKYERTTDNAGIISFQGYKFAVCAPKNNNIAKKKIELCVYNNEIKAYLGGEYYSVMLKDKMQDGIGETMSISLRNIIAETMLSDCKQNCA